MYKLFKIILICLGLTLFISFGPVNAQILKDTTVLKLVRKNIYYIYNQQFDNAGKVYTNIIEKYPEHPIVFLLKGILEYCENYPMLYTTPSSVTFEKDMLECIRLSETDINPDYKAEYLLADLCARGMLLTYYDDNDLIKEVIPLIKSTYDRLRDAFDLTSYCADLYYFTGLYNYYREGYPRAFPVYEPLLLLLPAGDMEKGIEELKKAAMYSVVLKADSWSLLSYIYLNFENKYPESLDYCKTLCKEYPENVFYRSDYIKNLLLMKQYDEAEKLMRDAYETEGNKYFQAQQIILKGILQEKRYHNNKLAEQYYNKGIRDLSLFGKYGNEFAAYAYNGLSRISELNYDKQDSKKYRKEAMKLATFKKINFDN